MTVHDLNRNQIEELKVAYAMQLSDCGELEEIAGVDTVSMDVIADINNIISDEIIYTHYDGIYFVEEDFFCNK